MKKLIVLLGPTGVGKTDISISLAGHYSCPVISADSRQLYKGMEIGTAAPGPEQLAGVKHYMIGILDITDYYSASEFENDCLNLIEEIQSEYIILSGGSMMYIDAICKGIDEIPAIASQLRQEIYHIYENEGLDPIRKLLKMLDPVFYGLVDLKNHKRVIHALEVCMMTGKPYSSMRTNTIKNRPFKIIKIGLMRERSDLYNRINQRVDRMIEQGLIEEARKFYPYKHLNSLNTVGYKELFNYFDGAWNLDFAIDKIKQSTRIYSRKQMTWFKRDKDINWINLTDMTESEIPGQITDIISKA